MDHETRTVLEAIERWREKGLVDEPLAAALSEEASSASRSRSRDLTRLLLAGTGATALLFAGWLFLGWAWPLLGVSARTSVLGVVGITVMVAGVRLEQRERWRPASWLMQVGGLGLVLSAAVYSEEAWADMSAVGVVMGAASLVIPIVLAPRAMGRNTVMPAVHLAFGLAFLAVFLDRATWMSGDQIVWTLDAVLVLALLVLFRLLAGDREANSYPWALNAFVAALLAGFVLIPLTGTGPLDLDTKVFWPLDAWLLLIVLLTHWGIHRAPPDLRRSWFGRVTAACMLVWIPFGFVTGSSLLGGPTELGMVLVGGAAVAGFVYGDRHHLTELLAASTLAFVVALWVWALDRAGALGAVLALATTAGLLFWVSGRLGKAEPST